VKEIVHSAVRRKSSGVLDVLGIDNDVKEYPDAHSFLNKHPAALAPGLRLGTPVWVS
jgi:hypothetical protein